MNTDDWMEMMTSDEPLHPDLVPHMEETSFGSMLKHPLVYSMMPHPASVNAQYAQKVEMLAKAKAEEDWQSVIWLHERPYRLQALMEIADQMDDEDYWVTVANVWIDSENIFQHLDDWMELFASDRPGRKIMMSDEEHRVLDAMTEPVTVYRGFTLGVNEDGLSWTVDLERATWFAKRFNHRGQGEIAQGTVERKDIVAYFTGRNESEIVVADLESVQVDEYLLDATEDDDEQG